MNKSILTLAAALAFGSSAFASNYSFSGQKVIRKDSVEMIAHVACTKLSNQEAAAVEKLVCVPFGVACSKDKYRCIVTITAKAGDFQGIKTVFNFLLSETKAKNFKEKMDQGLAGFMEPIAILAIGGLDNHGPFIT